MSVGDEYDDPYDLRIADETKIEWQCAVSSNDRFEPDEPEYCDHEPETVDLDEPATVDVHGEITLPGFPGECPVCGNPHEFEVNGLGVFVR